MKRKLIIDTDPGVDDAMAIQFALSCDQLEVIGLTTVFGNVPVELATSNTLRLLHLAGKDTIPVAKGAAKPMKGEFSGGASFVHGDDGMGNTHHPLAPLQPIRQQASAFIIEQITTYPGAITIVAIGPLTNLAEALFIQPEIAGLVAEVVIMGGNALCPGNITPAAEANMFADPDAADIVLGAGWPLTMVGLDATHRVNMRRDTLKLLAALESPLAGLVGKAMVFYQAFYETFNKIDGIYVHDSSAIAYLIAPHLFETSLWPVRVDTSYGIGRGKTWPCLEDPSQEENPWLVPWKGRPNINICIGADGEQIVKLITEYIAKALC
jgi:inosine-uridine nucleoside N-ribohydrolase